MKSKLLLILGLFFNLSVFADGYFGTTPISFNKCTGRATMEVALGNINGGTDDDWLNHANIYYKNNGGGWTKILTVTSSGYGCGAFDCWGGGWSATPMAGFDHSGSSSPDYSKDINIYDRDAGNGYHFANITFNRLPADIEISPTGSFSFKAQGQWENKGNQNDATDNWGEDISTTTIQSIDGITGHNATTEQCGKIDLNWPIPSQNWQNATTCTDYGSYSYEIYCNNNITPLATVNTNTWSVNVGTTIGGITFSVGTQYSFKLRVKWTPSGNTKFGSRYSSQSTFITGRSKPLPDQPTSLTASINKCTAEIDLNWQSSGSDIAYFKLFSELAPTVPTTLTPNSFSISPNDRNYTHTGVTRGQFYNYKLFSIDNCGNLSATGAFIKGISIADPLIANGLVATTNTVLGQVNLTWNDNSNNETKYQVIKSDNDGNSFTYEVNPNSGTGAVTYTDGLVSACKVYTYKVKVFNDCVLNGVLSTQSNSVILPPPDISASFNATNKLVASKGYFGNRVELSWSIANTSAVDYFKIYRKQLGTPLDSVQISSVPVGSALYVDNTADARVFYRYTIIGVKGCNGSSEFTNISSDIGFRNPTGVVSGHVEYNGGVAVGGAKVFVSSTNGNAGNSLNLMTGGTFTVNDSPTLEPGAQMRCEFWMKPNSVNGLVLNKDSAFSFGKDGGNYEAKIFIGGVAKIITIPSTYTNVTSITTSSTALYTQTIDPGYTTTITVNTFTTIPTKTVTAVTTVTNVLSNYTLTTITTTVTSAVGTYTTINNNQWTHVSLVYDGNTFKTFIDGMLRATTTATGNIDNKSKPLVFGDISSDFKIDEFRLIGQAANDSVISVESNRILNGDEAGFKCNLHFDEGIAKASYDPSKVSNLFNANHAVFTSTNVAWDSDIPTASQLGYFGVTNALGNYNVSGIRYLGTGENYNLTPNYQTHSFTPNTRSVFIGDASYVYNNQDFIDNSSFPVSGTLFYKNTTCPTPGATLKIDGQVVIKDGLPVQTDANGKFTITVPIGNHYIGVEKTQHSMEAGRYPLAGTHNFQAPVTGIQFIDSTRVKVIGRVVGGHIEAKKKPGMGRSKNNIGRAQVFFASPPSSTSPCYTTSVLTNSTTGEYVILMPPLDYEVTNAYVITNSLVINKPKLSNTNNLLSLSNPLVENKVIDSIKVLGVFTGVIDSAKYHKRLDFIYTEPTKDILVTRFDGSIFIGEDTLKEGTTKISVTPIPTNTTTLGNYGWGVFNWPVFQQNNSYYLKFKITENYLNTDNNKIDSVTLKGTAVFNNELVQGNDPNPTITFTAGVGTYSFLCGAPNTATSSIHPDLHYTKDIGIQFLIDGDTPVDWQPNGTLMDKDYHAIVMGAKTQGSGVATNGPEKVQFILRDPPGSGSYAKWSSTTSVAKRHSYSAGGSTNQGVSGKVKLGPEFQIGIGTATEIKTYNNITTGLQTTFGGRDMDETIDETTTGFAVQTRQESDFVGANADIFVGDSKNWLFGPTINIELIDVSRCTPNCFGPVINGKRLSRMLGFKIAEGATKTKFAYTQKEIEQNVIPSLEAIRNSILTSPNGRYTTTILPSNWRYGSNNDDPICWGTSVSSIDPKDYALVDTAGPSYIFHGRINGIKDSVREINNQIRIWKETLRDNEKDKYIAFSNSTGSQFDQNYTLGSALVTVNSTNTFTKIEESVFEFQMDEFVKAELGGTAGGIGVVVEPNLTLKQETQNIVSTTNVNTNATEYFFTDGDNGDIISFDSYKTHYGNVFITRGGQTMCPYEGPLVLNYYNPTNPNAYVSSHTAKSGSGTNLNNATIQREVPEINVIGSPAVYNVPSGQAAIYQVQISNQSLLTINNSVPFRLYTPTQSNPGGAFITVDGDAVNGLTTFSVAAGSSIIKTIAIYRGPVDINYDSLMVIMASSCSDKIADTIYLTAHFIPTCTDLTLNTPVNNFIINNSNNSFQNVVIDNYDYNYGYVPNTTQVANGTYTYIATSTNTLTGTTMTAVATATNYINVPVTAHPNFGLEKIGFEFKLSNTSQWLQIQDFYKNPIAAQAAGTNTNYIIPNGQVYTQYGWTVTPQSFADGNYDIRAVSYCYNKTGPVSVVYSPVLTGVMDRVNPHPFGTPSPGDGILDPNDDISIKFNEPINISSLSYAPVTSSLTGNFDIRGVLNGTDIRHSESINFDGTADYAEVVGGAGLQKRPFTFEFWAKFNPTGSEQTVISQGTDLNQNMTIGFDAINRLKFTLGNQIALATNPVITSTDWHHYAVSYDYQNADASLYVDGSLSGTNNNFLVDYTGSGKLAFGKALPANNNFFNGNMHEVRLWNKARTLSEITVTMNKVLSMNQSGLVYNWKMDEADGSFAKDDIRSRNADIYGATWEVNPNGSAAQFDGADDNIEVSSGNITINKEMDFTLEFWFNSNQPGIATLFSNGEGAANTADSLNAWTIQKDATGKIHVYHKGLDFVAVTNNFFDGNWHHFAVVMNRTANLTAYVDGNIQNSVQGINFHNLSGSKFFLGAKATVSGSTTTLSDYYSGKMDEFRLWNTARKVEQVKRDKQNRMLGNEAGLLTFIPFEHYAVVLGTPSLTATFNNQSQSTLTVTAQNGTQLISQTPTIKLPRPVQSVNYTWSLNNDQIILSTTADPAIIENVTLDITVQNAYDMHGNKMQSPKTWIAYINKNQVKWQDDEFNLEKKVDTVITIVAPIVNSGGAQKAFTIGGLPSWMTSSATNGVIAPNSVQNITLTIPAGQAVGDYNAGVTVTTDFGYDEVLQINLKVKGVVPTWTVNAANYQYQMNIFGQLKIDGIIATNPESKIAAFCNGVVRGVANLQYVPAYDRYEAFLNIYSNTTFGDSIYFNIYDASTGVTFVTVDSSLTFMDNQVIGTVANPRTFSANSEISRSIVLNTGWTWVSFPLKTSKMNNSNSLLSTINPATGDIITGSVDYDQYDASLGWLGNISGNGGFKNNQSYKIKKATGETLLHIGARLNPDSTQATINVVPGWNWIGFISNKNLPIAEALGNYNAITGDIIKSQYEFAYYDNLTGWSGSLTTMKPTMGYMLKSSGTSTFNYPLLGFFGARTHQVETNHEPQTAYPFTPEQYSNTMSLIVKGNLCSEMLSQGNIVLGLFDNTNALRGYAHPTFANNSHKFYITAYSNTSAESLSLKYFNTSNGEVYATDTAVTFNVDAIIGTPSNPIRANLQDSLTCKLSDVTTSINESESIDMVVSPNPFEDNLSIQFHKELNGKVEVLDVLGKVIYASDVKNKRVVNLYFIKSNVPIAAGIYYIRVSGDVNKQIKVVKTK